MGYTAGNPASVIQLHPRNKKPETVARALSPEELGAAWVATSYVEKPWRWFCRLLLLTACRKTEVLALAWDEIADDASHFTIPADRAKMNREQRVELSKLAQKQLIEIPKLASSRYVFSNRSGQSWLGRTRLTNPCFV
jgi:integrase